MNYLLLSHENYLLIFIVIITRIIIFPNIFKKNVVKIFVSTKWFRFFKCQETIYLE